jgi:dTDP-4-dehydrorhamnose 3,5-epimerase-like enzyme
VQDERGRLGILEVGETMPFPARRVFFTYGLHEKARRGGHAHRASQEIIVCIDGTLAVTLDTGRETVAVRLTRSGVGLYLPPMLWSELHDFNANTVYLVMASTLYEAGDYIRDYALFCRLVGAGPANVMVEVDHVHSSL